MNKKPKEKPTAPERRVAQEVDQEVATEVVVSVAREARVCPTCRNLAVASVCGACGNPTGAK